MLKKRTVITLSQPILVFHKIIRILLIQSTKISWQSPVGAHQSLIIYNVLGKEVETLVSEYRPAGKYEIIFNADGLPSGVYFYQLKADSFVETRKMILIK